ncbi:MAG TPA: HAD family hydrolase [Gemmatimonadota bacterium]|nr:HAD family hydrolase [Gemmatimonadota bacterium]
MRRAAFFDVDGTVVAGDIVRYGVEIRTMHRSRLGRLAWIAAFLPRVPWLLALDAWRREAFQRSFYRIYRGLDADELDRRAGVLFRQYIEPRIYPQARERIERHRARGDQVVLITGSIEAIVAPLAEHLRVSSVIAPRLAVEDGRLTGELVEAPVAGERKAERMSALAEERGIDLQASVAYGDSADDLPMLERAGRAAVVNPRGRLLDQAMARNWEILYWGVGR